MRILLVEDEKRLSHYIKKGLEEQGYAVDQTYDGEEGLYLAKEEAYDVIILDVMLPKMNGMDVCRNLRKDNRNMPVIMLTARSETEDKIEGLDCGADDYLTKPFVFDELRARIHAVLRRSYKQASNSLSVADLEVDPSKHTAKRGGREIKLTPKEFSILELLLLKKNSVVTRTQITEHVWDYNFESMSNVVDVFMAALRRKVDKGYKTKLIQTVHGVGYLISDGKTA